MKIYIFISYGHDNYSESAQILYDQLQKDEEDFVIWWDKKLKASDDWVAEIERHLNNLIYKKPDSCFIYVVTPYSSNTDRDNFCIKEIAKAIGGRVRVIPLKLVEAPMPLLLSNVQWLDFTDVEIDSGNQEFVRRIDHLRTIIREGKELPLDGKQEVLRNWLHPCSFTLDLEKHLTNYKERPWLLDKVNRWIEETDEHLLLMLGGPGTGKTAFSVWMSYSKLSHYVAAWHLCQYNNKRTCSLRTAVKSLAYYLAARLPAYYNQLDIVSVDKILSENDLDAGTLFLELILEKLQQINHGGSKLVILIDALDEASHDNHNELAEVLVRYSEQLPQWLKIIITSRNDPSVTSYLADSSRIINLDDTRTVMQSALDVSNYVNSRLEGNTKHANYVIRESGNNFLYAQLLCNTICESPEFSLGSLPTGINSYYNDYLRRYLKNSSYDFDQHAIPLLNIILTAYEPLEIESIFERLRKTCSWCKRRSDLNGVVKCFGPLLIESSDSYIPFHKSLSDWFLNHKVNDEFRVYRKDGLDEMVDWGLEVTAPNNTLKKGPLQSHFYRYLPQYMIELEDYDKIVELYTDVEFWKRRLSVLGVNEVLTLLIDELSQCPLDLRQLLYANELFFNVLNLFNIDLFNTGRYNSLMQLGYKIIISSGMDDQHRLFAVRFYYINGLYDEIEKHISVFEEPYADSIVEAMLMNELGQTFRKFGQLSRSAYFYEKSLKGAIDSGGTEDEIIYTMLNLSRIFMLQRRETDARQMLNDALNRFDSGLWRTSMQGTDVEFSAQQLERAVNFVALETEMYSLQTDHQVCAKSLEWANGIYAIPSKRDRYYGNHLISKLFYLLRKGNIDNLEELLSECDKSVNGQYDRLRLTIALCLLDLCTGNKDKACQTAKEQIEILSTLSVHRIQKTEFAAIVDYITGTQPIPIDEELKLWYQHFLHIIDSLISLQSLKNR